MTSAKNQGAHLEEAIKNSKQDWRKLSKKRQGLRAIDAVMPVLRLTGKRLCETAGEAAPGKIVNPTTAATATLLNLSHHRVPFA
jgi:hypothetical protein